MNKIRNRISNAVESFLEFVVVATAISTSLFLITYITFRFCVD